MERKAIFLGDSITEGVGVSDESKTYWSLVGKALNLQVKYYGVSGTRIAPQLVEINKDWSESFIDRAKIMDKDAVSYVFLVGQMITDTVIYRLVN